MRVERPITPRLYFLGPAGEFRLQLLSPLLCVPASANRGRRQASTPTALRSGTARSFRSDSSRVPRVKQRAASVCQLRCYTAYSVQR